MKWPEDLLSEKEAEDLLLSLASWGKCILRIDGEGYQIVSPDEFYMNPEDHSDIKSRSQYQK